jgi:transposase
MRVFGGFLDKLKASTEGDSTLLDRSSIFFASNLGNASNHDNTNLPVILAGGVYKHAGHLAHDKQNNTFLSNLYVRMLQQTGIELDKFGANTGVLSEI